LHTRRIAGSICRPCALGNHRYRRASEPQAIAQCLKRYGEAALITALQCVTQTSNNKPGALPARTTSNPPALKRRAGDHAMKNVTSKPELQETGSRLAGGFAPELPVAKGRNFRD